VASAFTLDKFSGHDDAGFLFTSRAYRPNVPAFKRLLALGVSMVDTLVEEAHGLILPGRGSAVKHQFHVVVNLFQVVTPGNLGQLCSTSRLYHMLVGDQLTLFLSHTRPMGLVQFIN
jgi:hypothetical protein